jgi:hypothetical protein
MSSGIVIHRSRHAQQFVVVPNSIARDGRLSFRARGLLVMLLSLPSEWHLTTDSLAEDNPDSRTAIRAAMQELRHAGYVELVTERGSDGRIRRHLEVFDTPQTRRGQAAPGPTSGNDASSQVAPNAGIPAAGKPAAGKPAAGKPAAGKPADKRSTERSTELEKTDRKHGSLSRAAVALADAGATEREILEIVRKIEADPSVRYAAAYLKAAIGNGDAAVLIAEARNQLEQDEAMRRTFSAGAAGASKKPPWCGQCDKGTRLTTGPSIRRCPDCHPLTQDQHREDGQL